MMSWLGWLVGTGSHVGIIPIRQKSMHFERILNLHLSIQYKKPPFLTFASLRLGTISSPVGYRDCPQLPYRYLIERTRFFLQSLTKSWVSLP
ncbi:hypothetical protein BCIN_15g00160 [Botrytis cinerea B05.10]|uniref:Uncharacterized protein n=1 Tax=Botryotinia fuckeliana (strain B05.10) TaxID=332648 RepID=A0A384K3P0_BOTFB|nr:hypothetical protein BCIN_15g00160 [Botrytis cinerea B05.10]ATZ57433.1 hypothetical protein BCIN_15g00160 [Botrytis cinerea B05.10]